MLLEADIIVPFFGFSFYQGNFYVVYKLVINLFGLLLHHRPADGRLRYGQHLPKSQDTTADDIVLGILLFLGVRASCCRRCAWPPPTTLGARPSARTRSASRSRPIPAER